MTQVDTPQSRCRFALEWVDVTPPADIYHRMWGAATHDRATGIHRPLRATVTVFAPLDEDADDAEVNANDDATALQVLVALDHCVLGREEMQALVDAVSSGADVPRDSIAVVFSHTHSAGLMGLERRSLPGGDLIPPYLELLGERVAELTQQALASLAHVDIVYGVGRCNLAAQRDFWDEERKLFACGFNPGAPADDTVLVARVTDAKGNLRATIVNYACHPTTLAWGNTLVSPDYPGAMRDVIERDTGAPCLFLQGASGDLGPREGFVGDTAVADRNGGQLGYAALSALAALPAAGTTFRYDGPVISGATIGTWSHAPRSSEQQEQAAQWAIARGTIDLEYRPGQPSVEQVAQDLKEWQAKEAAAQQAGDKGAMRDARAMVERKTRLHTRLAKLPPGERYPLEMVLLRAGDAIWLIIQGEHYQTLQTELRARFPQAAIVVAAIASDWSASYLPPAEIYDTGVYQETIAVVAPGSLERVIEEASRGIERLLR